MEFKRPSTGAVLSLVTQVVMACSVVGAMVVLIWSSTERHRAQEFKLNSSFVPSVSLDRAVTEGLPTARVAVVEFSDYLCSFCRDFATVSRDVLRQDFVSTGKVLWAFRHLPVARLHPNAVKAAEAAECARRQMRFWEMHNLLFGHRGEMTADRLVQYAVEAGIDRERFARCLGGEASSAIQRDIDEGKKIGLRMTPTFLIGYVEANAQLRIVRRIEGVVSHMVFGEILDGVLATVDGREPEAK